MVFFLEPIKYFFLTIRYSVFVEHLPRKQLMLVDLKKKKNDFYRWININKYSWERNNCFTSLGSVTFYIVHPRIRKRHRQSEKYAAPLQLQGLEKRFIPSAVWDTPSLPQNGVVFRWIFLIFFPPSIIILLILEKYQAHGYSSNLSSTFNCVETKGTCRVSFLQTNIYRVERSLGWE